MTQLGGRQWWTAVSAALTSEQHLATEAVVAYVDNELTLSAHGRATQHLAQCALCTAEAAAQRQARAAVRGATAPTMTPALLAALHAIPQSADLPPGPEELAVNEDGELVVVQRPSRSREVSSPVVSSLEAPPLGLSAPLGSSPRLGSSPPLGSAAVDRARLAGARGPRRLQSAVVVSGLVFGALALVSAAEPTLPGVPQPGSESGGSQPVTVPARFDIEPRDATAERVQGAALSGLVLR
jgi:hypothetical protein